MNGQGVKAREIFTWTQDLHMDGGEIACVLTINGRVTRRILGQRVDVLNDK